MLHSVLVGTNNCCHRKAWVLLLEPWAQWKSTRFAGDEIKFHSPSESLRSRWRLSFSLRLALARQIQMPPTLRQTQRALARTQCPARRLCFWCLVFCSCMLLASVSACLCARFCHFITTRMVWPDDCSESTPLFSSIKWSWSLKHGETCCVVQGWVVSKM